MWKNGSAAPPNSSTDGYRINSINGTNCFVINDGLSAYLFQNDDNGLPAFAARDAADDGAHRASRIRSSILMNNWEDFGTKANADAYDKNIRWLASHPWIEMVTPDQIVDIGGHSVPPDGTGDAFGYVDRGTGLTLPQVAQDFIDHATEENYDNWYYGSTLEESLSTKLFNIRPGAPMPEAFGLEAGPNATGIASDAWAKVASMTPATL